MQQKSLVELLYEALAAKMHVRVAWHDLNFMEQSEFIEGINCILSVMESARQYRAGE